MRRGALQDRREAAVQLLTSTALRDPDALSVDEHVVRELDVDLGALTICSASPTALLASPLGQ